MPSFAEIMTLLAGLFTVRPQVILAVALTMLAVYLLLLIMETASPERLRPLLIVALLWGCYAIWESLVLLKAPQAHLRIDLLVIWPLLVLSSVWALLNAFR